MKDRDIFQDDLHTADKIEAARQARERQINKGIMTNPISSISSDVEKAVQSQACPKMQMAVIPVCSFPK